MTLLASGAIGFLLGAVRSPTWHDALEPAQVLAGLVRYPPDNPTYVYSTRAWSVLNQLLALPLQAGVSERTLTVILSGVVGMISLQTLAVIILALCDDIAMAVAAPFIIYFTDAASGGLSYPVQLMGTSATYGVIGFSYLVLTIALIGIGRVEWAALLLGFGPAIHASIGAWAILIVAIAAALDRRWARDRLVPALPYFLAGAAATVVSAAVHYVRGYHMTPAEYLSAIGMHWTDHRLPFPIFTRGPAIVVMVTSFALLWTWRFRAEMPHHVRRLLQLLIITTVVGATMSATYWIVPADKPNPIAWMMPSRLLNISEYTWMALLVGLSARYRHNVWIQVNLLAMIVVTCLNPQPRGDYRAAVTTVVMAVSMALLILLAEDSRRGIAPAWTPPVAPHVVRRATLLIIAAVFIVVFGGAVRDFGDRMIDLMDRTNDAALARAAARPGLILTSSDLHLIQLTTRRPVLLDGLATDGLVYVPTAIPATEWIMRRVYGVELRALEARGAGGFWPEAGQALWNSRTVADWQAIAREFNVTDVLTYPGWTLQLPLLARTENFSLFEIPR